jgi:hypothetical protein
MIGTVGSRSANRQSGRSARRLCQTVKLRRGSGLTEVKDAVLIFVEDLGGKHHTNSRCGSGLVDCQPELHPPRPDDQGPVLCRRGTAHAAPIPPGAKPTPAGGPPLVPTLAPVSKAVSEALQELPMRRANRASARLADLPLPVGLCEPEWIDLTTHLLCVAHGCCDKEFAKSARSAAQSGSVVVRASARVVAPRVVRAPGLAVGA